MAVDPRKRQKKQERKAAKRKEKHQQLVRERNVGLPERMTAAARYPVLHSWVTTDLWTQGMGWALLSRELPNSSVAYALFLIDRYCLGIKNVVAGVVSRFAYESDIERRTRSGYTVEPMPPADLRKLVEDAVFYARNIGFGPHPDYHKAMPIFGDINDRESDARFEFGKDGQPFFIAGPNEGPSRCRHILKTLEEHCGRGGFHFLIPTAQRELLHEEEPEALEGPDAQS